MKTISEIIEELKVLQEIHGDIFVIHSTFDSDVITPDFRYGAILDKEENEIPCVFTLEGEIYKEAEQEEIFKNNKNGFGVDSVEQQKAFEEV